MQKIYLFHCSISWNMTSFVILTYFLTSFESFFLLLFLLYTMNCCTFFAEVPFYHHYPPDHKVGENADTWASCDGMFDRWWCRFITLLHCIQGCRFNSNTRGLSVWSLHVLFCALHTFSLSLYSGYPNRQTYRANWFANFISTNGCLHLHLCWPGLISFRFGCFPQENLGSEPATRKALSSERTDLNVPSTCCCFTNELETQSKLELAYHLE